MPSSKPAKAHVSSAGTTDLARDPSVYDMFYELCPEWPCLSFDLLDGRDGQCSEYPYSVSMVAGSQASATDKNRIYLIHCANLAKTKESESDSESDEEEDCSCAPQDPALTYKTVPHRGGVNRIRAWTGSDQTSLVSTWSDQGVVGVYSLQESAGSLSSVFSHCSHSTEGYALDWCRVDTGTARLASGDNKGDVCLAEAAESGWNVHTMGQGHRGSVEDIQWSPNEHNVLISCSADQHVNVWDTRTRGCISRSKCAASDINVISWSAANHYQLASGNEDGAFCIWDTRHMGQGQATPISRFEWHAEPITSLEWNPRDSPVILVSSHSQLTIWDLDLEVDREAPSDDPGPEVPPQLLFVHRGQREIKEAHWHRQISGLMASTSLTGFNIFKTINVE